MMTDQAGTFEGQGVRVAVCTARFNDLITGQLVQGCRDALERYGVRGEDIHWAEVPGSRELPVACKALASSGRYDAVIALGCVIRGETVHFELVAHETSRGLGQAAVETGVPIIFGVLATENLEQAMDRAGGKMGNAGWNAAVSAIETANLLDRIAKRSSNA
jgi:6,7-dimethyl-8-ribityllumazine synthase